MRSIADDSTYRHAIRNHIRSTRANLLKARYPTDHSELTGQLRGLEMALLTLDALATFHAVNRQGVAV